MNRPKRAVRTNRAVRPTCLTALNPSARCTAEGPRARAVHGEVAAREDDRGSALGAGLRVDVDPTVDGEKCEENEDRY
jgi:hypothetical protein